MSNPSHKWWSCDNGMPKCSSGGESARDDLERKSVLDKDFLITGANSGIGEYF